MKDTKEEENGVKAKFDSYFLQYMHDKMAITSLTVNIC